MKKTEIIQALTEIQEGNYINITEQVEKELEYLWYIEVNTGINAMLGSCWLTENGEKYLEENVLF